MGERCSNLPRSCARLLSGAAILLSCLGWAVCRAQGASSPPASVMAPAQVADAGNKSIPAERFFQHPFVLQVRLSPSGRFIAMSATRDDKHASLFVVDLRSTDMAHVVASYANLDVTDFHWVGDQRLVYSVGELEPGKSSGFAPGLFGVDVDGGHRVELLCSDVRTCIKDGQYQEVMTHLLFVPNAQVGVRPDEVVVGETRRGRFAHVVPQWMNTRTGNVRELAMPDAPAGAIQWWFDSHGEPRVAMTSDGEDRAAFAWRGPGDAAWHRIAEFDIRNPPFWPVEATADGRLYITQSRGAAHESVLTTFDFKTQAPAEHALVATPGFDFSGVLVSDEVSGRLLGAQLDAETASSVWFDEPMAQLQVLVDKRFPGRVNTIECRHCGQPDATVLVNSASDHDPGHLLLYHVDTGRWENVAAVMAGIEARRMASVEFQRIKARDGRDLPVWLTLPTGQPAGKPAPAVVMVHGGPWVRGGHWHWDPMAQFLASRGYLVIEPEFRGSAGYGDDHLHAGDRQWGQAMQDDVADALIWAQKQGMASQRACIAGASFGGYSALMGLVRDPQLYRCGIAWVALADPFLYLKGSFFVWDDLSPWARRYVMPELVGDADRDAAMLIAASPVAQAARIRAPVLLAYGGKDVRVPLEHGERLRAALEKAGNPPDWVVYPKEGHGWRSLADRVDWAQRVEKFLARNLSGDDPQ